MCSTLVSIAVTQMKTANKVELNRDGSTMETTFFKVNLTGALIECESSNSPIGQLAG